MIPKVTMHFVEDGTRHCGGCTACCKLTPVKELAKPALTRCTHQRTGKGCAIYERRPGSCRLWNCAWVGADAGTEKMSRPDRAGYVVDVMPDFIKLRNEETGEVFEVGVVQVWCDPKRPNAWRDPALRAYIELRGKRDGFATLIRMGNESVTAVFPQSIAPDGKWHEMRSGVGEKEHSFADIAATIARL